MSNHASNFIVSAAMRSTDIVSAALSYAEQSIPVLPIFWVDANGHCGCGVTDCQSPGKHPIAQLVRHGLKGATTDASLIKKFWRRFPRANLAIVPVGDLAVVDIDGPEGERALEAYDLPATATVTTKRGRHLYFHLPKGKDLPRLPANSKVDYRANGNGYVLAPPSKHPSGMRYSWNANDRAATWTPVASEGRKLKLDLRADRIHSGGRNSRLTSIAGSLRNMGLDASAIEVALHALNDKLCSPPLPDREISTIARSVGSYAAPVDGFSDMADVEIEKVRWLFEPYIPRGTLTMLEGNPGVGKSSLISALAAAVTRGDSVPWSTSRSQGRVLLMSAEDDVARILKPRLQRHRADFEFVRYQSDPFNLDDAGLRRLRVELETHFPKLVVIDTVVAYLASGEDLNDAGDMTRFLTTLDLMAREFDTAIVLVRHFRKSREGAAINQGLGSIALAGRVRSILAMGRHPDDPALRAVAHIKSNYAREGETIEVEIVEQSGQHPLLRWHGTNPDLTFEMIMKVEVQARGRPPSERTDAEELLRALLKDGPVPLIDVKRAGEARGMSWMTMRRASRDLHIVSTRSAKTSVWSLP